MSKQVTITDSLVFNPTGYTGNSNFNAGTGTQYQPSNGYHSYSGSASTTNSARWTPTTSAGYVYYTFSISGIPSDATITSVSCIAKIWVSSTSRVTSTNIALYRSTTSISSSSTYSSTSTSNTVTINATTVPTVSQLSNLRLRFGAIRSSSGGGGQSTGYVYFYGADLTINYTYQGTTYEITSTLATNAVDSINPAGYTEVNAGNNYELTIYTDNADDIIVEDNGVDVTNQLVLVHGTGDSSTATFIPSSFDSASSSYDSIYNSNNPENGLTNHSSSTRCCAYVVQTAYAEAKLVYNFDCSSIPFNAIISNVTCQVGASCYSSGQYFDTRTLQLYTGTTAKGTATTNTGNGSSATVHTVNGGTNWTRAELDNIKIVEYVQRGNNTTQASFSFFGATLSVSYSLPAEDYYTYTLTNVSADHTILISDAIIEIPDEDPQYDYYPITISSINADTDPGRGTTRVVEGTSQTITIYPEDPSITLVTDNGVDITNQLVQHGGTIPTPTVATLSGASYGFDLSTNGYYISSNKGVSKSAAVCRVSFDLPVRCLVTINYINYAEATYDFGVFGNIDVALSTSYYAAGSGGATITDSSYRLACNTSAYNTSSVQTLTYEIQSGQHYIDIKYSKDDATNNNNDTLQWKIASIEALEANNYYTYTLSNIDEAHSLIFIFGNVTYYFVNTSAANARLFPSGSTVQLPGDSYRLTIVPDNYDYEISLTDNNVDRTAYVERKEEEITKDGETYTVVNYVYNLTNIQATHTIEVVCSPSSALYIKISGAYVLAEKVYKKVSGSWVEQTNFTAVFDPNQIYVSGN
jgi:hypothetical protein